MPRNREFLPETGVLIHVWNEGVDRGPVFLCNTHYERYLELLLRASVSTGVMVLAYVLTPERFDLIVLQSTPHTVSAFMKMACNAYSRMLNQRLKRRGHSFRERYEGEPIRNASEFLRAVFDVHSKPVEAGLAETPRGWPYSSCRGYLGRADGGSLVDHSFLWALVGGADKYARFQQHFDPADPGAADDFLCENWAEIWETKGIRSGRRKIHTK